MSRPPLPSTDQPSKTAGGEGIAAKVDAMGKRLQEHSALEDPRPFSGPETCEYSPAITLTGRLRS